MFNCKIDIKNVKRSYGIEQHVREHEHVNMSISALNWQCIQLVVCCVCVCVFFCCVCYNVRKTTFYGVEPSSHITLGILARLIFFCVVCFYFFFSFFFLRILEFKWWDFRKWSCKLIVPRWSIRWIGGSRGVCFFRFIYLFLVLFFRYFYKSSES